MTQLYINISAHWVFAHIGAQTNDTTIYKYQCSLGICAHWRTNKKHSQKWKMETVHIYKLWNIFLVNFTFYIMLKIYVNKYALNIYWKANMMIFIKYITPPAWLVIYKCRGLLNTWAEVNDKYKLEYSKEI